MSNVRWDRHFLQLALDHARMSKDPSTKVGAIIVGPDREIRSVGFNGFPRGIEDHPNRLNDRETKLKLMVHGEMNAVLAAARANIPIKGCTMYIAATSNSTDLNDLSSNLQSYYWGGPPCTRCTVEVIQAGIARIISWPIKLAPSRWHDDILFAKSLLEEAGIEFIEIEH